MHITPRRAGDGPTGERHSAFHCLAVVRPRAQGSPAESWQCFGYVASALAPPRGGNTQRPTRVTHACRAPAQHHLCTEIRAPRAQRSTSATQPILAPSETRLRNSGRLPEVYIRLNYSGESIDKARTAWRNAPLCEAVPAFCSNLASGNRETPYSDADTAPRGSEVPVFTVPFPARLSATRQIPGDPMREFRGTPVFLMFSRPRFGLRWRVALVASLGSFGVPRGLGDRFAW